ncbi:lactate dehydrogenase [bacterium]|nr:lactate dehydrogenase [bacterium]
MNAVEIEEAVSKLAEMPFDAESFPYAFLEAFGNKQATIQRLKSGASNKSDVTGGVLQFNNIHIAVAELGKVNEKLGQLRNSPATKRQKTKFILSTDGTEFHAEDLTTDEPPVICSYKDFPDHFGYFLPLAGISTVKQIRESSFDIKATGRLNRLYVELLKDNPRWGAAERRHDMNHFMARLIFCFFAEDTGIFKSIRLFSSTVEQMSGKDSANTNEVISEIFRAMNTDFGERPKANLPRWVEEFPYVNGGLFSGSVEVPKFSKIARSYLLHIGRLDWQKINPDIFGSMIQAVTEDEERGSLGMHYTSVPNILRVLNPLFLDDLRSQLDKAGDNPRALLNLRKRISKIRVFDPACGSGNFLVIAYKEMRVIEAEINKRRGEPDTISEIQLTNFRGIELRDFPAEIARLALIIAEYQCNVLYIGQMNALLEFLPLNAENWIVTGNALKLDWSKICVPHISFVKTEEDDLFRTPKSQAEIDFDYSDFETYICGNPPYAGLSSQTDEQKNDLRALFEDVSSYWKSFDYVMGWFWKARNLIETQNAKVAFVSTNSICQGQLVPMFWPLILKDKIKICFAYSSFKWKNLAANNAGVMVVIIGLSRGQERTATIFDPIDNEGLSVKETSNINAYIVAGPNIYIEPLTAPPVDRPQMFWGNKPTDGGNLIMEQGDAKELLAKSPGVQMFLRPYFGSDEFIKGAPRACIWVNNNEKESAFKIEDLATRFDKVEKFRLSSTAKETRSAAKYSHRFRQIQGTPGNSSIIIPIHTSERREFLPVGLLPPGAIISNAAFGLYDSPIWCLSILASKMHIVWVATVCGKIKTDYRYSNTLGWNTFPLPKMTEQNKQELTKCAEELLIAREAHFPATIANLYETGKMPEDLRRAHERNDEVLERIYIGRKFKNDTERLEKLFELYTKIVAAKKPVEKNKKAKKKEVKS